MATIDDNVPIKLDLDHCHLTPPDIEALNDFFGKLEFKTLVNRLPKVLKNFNLSQSADNANIEPASTEEKQPMPEKIKAVPENVIINSPADLDSLVKTLSKQPAISLYVQATTEDPTIVGYAFAWSENKSKQSAYIPLKQLAITLTNQPGLDRQLVNETVYEIFNNHKIDKIVYNSKSTLNLLSNVLPLVNISFDPMLASYICFPDHKHDLHEQAGRLLNYPMEHRSSETNKSKKNTQSNNAAMLSGINLAELANNACEDARLSLELADYYVKNMDKDQKFLLYDMDLPLSIVLAKMEQLGVALDLPFLKHLSKELDTELKSWSKKFIN